MTKERHRLRTSRGGFTLIELLVVVSIIVILIALLLPSLAKARDRAKSVSCRSSMKQIHLGFAMYVKENDDHICDSAIYEIVPSMPSRKDWVYWWSTDLVGQYFSPPAPYYSKPKFVFCPDQPIEQLQGGTTSAIGLNDTPNTNFSSPSSNPGSTYTRWTMVAAPAECVFLIDTNASEFWRNGGAWYAPPTSPTAYADLALAPNHWAWDNCVGFRHGNVCNVVFVDGHTETFINASSATQKPYFNLGIDMAYMAHRLTNDASRAR